MAVKRESRLSSDAIAAIPRLSMFAIAGSGAGEFEGRGSWSCGL